jgi:hypothetical protein
VYRGAQLALFRDGAAAGAGATAGGATEGATAAVRTRAGRLTGARREAALDGRERVLRPAKSSTDGGGGGATLAGRAGMFATDRDAYGAGTTARRTTRVVVGAATDRRETTRGGGSAWRAL